MIRNDPIEFQPSSEKISGIWRGVIEDNKDPEKRGRCRIRIFGIHTDLKEKTQYEGIPTDELPWAEPAYSLMEGGVSGYGSWCVPVQGSQVFLFFENGHILKPRFFASIPGVPTDPQFDEESKAGAQDYKSRMKDNSKKIYDRVQNNPDDIEFLNSNELGSLSKRWESGSAGPYAVSSGQGDPGGVSYGSYQFASNRGTVEPFVQTLPPEIQSNFDGLTPGTPEYSAAWRASVNQMGADEFHNYEKAYVKANYYDVAANNINRSTGINANERSAGVQDMIWSMSVQHGTSGADRIMKNAGVTNDMSDEEIINRCYKERSNVDKYFKSSSPGVKNSVTQRFQAEHRMALAKANVTNPPAEDTMPEKLATAKPEDFEKDTSLSDSEFKKSFQDGFEKDTSQIGGFEDPDGSYPTIKRLNEPSAHRLFRETGEDTILDIKKQNVKKGIELAQNKGTWNEPTPAYAPEYPHNTVIATHSGIVIEIDSTPNKQRLHIFHPSNTYVEIDYDGNMVIRNSGNKYEITEQNSYKLVERDLNETINNNKTTYVKSNEYEQIGVNKKLTIGGDYDIEIAGTCNLKATKINFN